MALTAIDVIKWVLNSTGQDQNVTAFSDDDNTNYLKDRLNDVLEELSELRPLVIHTNGTITMVPSTRTFAGPSNVELINIFDWSWRIDGGASGDTPLTYVPYSYIQTNYDDFETKEAAEPDFVYFDDDLVAFYPLLNAGASNLTIQFRYSAPIATITATTDTFDFEDQSTEMRFIKHHIKAAYEYSRGFDNSESVIKAGRLKNKLKARYITQQGGIGLKPVVKTIGRNNVEPLRYST